MKRFQAWLMLFLGLGTAPLMASAQGERSAPSLSDTLGSFTFVDTLGSAERPISVWYYRPTVLRRDAGIVFVMHGSSRTGEAARDLGVTYARAHGDIVLAPEFSERYYPGDSYAFGNMIDSTGRLRSESRWALSAIEHLFDTVVRAAGLTTSTYDLVGHSAGGQFVQRLVLFLPRARFRRAVASSPGRYAFPLSSAAFPYGLRGTRTSSAALARSLSRDLVLLLGDRDTQDRPREPEALSQGRNRFARGLRFFATATEVANNIDAPLAWRLVILHGADHSPGPMIEAGLRELR